jgi:hypothetical protein
MYISSIYLLYSNVDLENYSISILFYLSIFCFPLEIIMIIYRYAGLKRNGTTSSGINIISNDVWPYLPDLAPPKWKADGTL